jgi:hypothetical protein
VCVFVSLTGLNNRSPKAQATCGHHGPANIKSLIISHYHFNGIPTTFCGWLMHLTTLIAHNSKIQKKNWMNSFRFQCPNSRPHLAVNLKSNFKRCSLEHGDGTYPQWQSQCSFPCVEHETNFHVPTFFLPRWWKSSVHSSCQKGPIHRHCVHTWPRTLTQESVPLNTCEFLLNYHCWKIVHLFHLFNPT